MKSVYTLILTCFFSFISLAQNNTLACPSNKTEIRYLPCNGVFGKAVDQFERTNNHIDDIIPRVDEVIVEIKELKEIFRSVRDQVQDVQDNLYKQVFIVAGIATLTVFVTVPLVYGFRACFKCLDCRLYSSRATSRVRDASNAVQVAAVTE